MECFRYYYRGYKRERPIKISLFPENLDQKYFVQKTREKSLVKTSENRKENCRKKFCTQKFSKNVWKNCMNKKL